ncbi:MAG TPA: prepilin-type N-terminal cleavage/methylation domain-containing protein [Gemmataceae bacterium]|jgi:prepilin-type N-terminal cleavage/methylation domain-containing protein
MITRARFNRSGRVEREAFTLMEMMVVITIMAALIALSASAVMKFIAVQQTTNTQSTLDRVQSQLIKAWSKVKDQAIKESIDPSVMLLKGTDPNAQERARVLHIKLKLRQAFPMTFNEALNPAPLQPLQGYVSYLTNLGITGSSAATAPIESSACLLMALQRGVSGAGIDPSDLTAGGAAGSLPLPGGSLPYLTDAWARPIFFTRVPAGNLYLNPVTPTSVANVYTTLPWSLTTGLPVTCYSQPGSNDPGDPTGLLVSTPWRTVYGPPFFAATSEVVPLLPQGANTSFKLAPMVASGGPSDWTKPGQFLPFDPLTFYAVPGGNAQFSTP